MAEKHIVRTMGDATYEVPTGFTSESEGFHRWSIVEDLPAVHTGFAVCELEPGGSIESRLHSFEESFYMLEGEVTCETVEGAFTLGPGDNGVVVVGSPHRWRNEGDTSARWARDAGPSAPTGIRRRHLLRTVSRLSRATRARGTP